MPHVAVGAEVEKEGVFAARWPIWALAGTILLSALLLFQVQPLVSKYILPWFGGCPAVWTTCLLFFQTLLFGGYLYAHLGQRLLTPRGQVAVHVLLVATALMLLPIAPGADWKPADSAAPTWRILLLLTATVGLPYFALSATSPLIQAWFSRSYPGRSPYRLYALSNVGSLVGLVSYPFLIEPAFELDTQSALWSLVFGGYALLCFLCGAWLWRLRPAASQSAYAVESAGGQPQSRTTAPPTWHRAAWLVLPACASLMLLATTNHVCQDVAVVPFLWVVPLTLYLLSFILCFDSPRWYVRSVWAGAAAMTILAVAGYKWFGFSLDFAPELVLYFSALFAACMVCHGELVRLRPDPRHLTEFYLLMAAGGALGGVFVNLVAPWMFSNFWEWQIGLIACYVLAVTVLASAGSNSQSRSLRNLLIVATAIVGSTCIITWLADRPSHGWTLVERSRNFYGVVAVQQAAPDDPEHHVLRLMHGVTAHGVQCVAVDKSRWPTTYYGQESGVGQAIRFFRGRKIRVGLVGLGVGTLATFAQPGDHYRFYEINPAVETLARERFAYLRDCRGAWEVVPGDARLSLERELEEDGPQNYHVLVLDAFSSDAIPTHLLTCEAFDFYRRHLAADGVIAFHITNRYLDLAPVVRGLARHYVWKTILVRTKGDAERLLAPASWMLLTRNEEILEAVSPGTAPEDEDDRTTLWTDHYSNLFGILKKRG